MTQIKISIPEPCNENWNTMTGVEKKRFCKVCSKNVRDFRDDSLEDIATFLANNKKGSICGVFRKDDLQEMTLKNKLRFLNKKYSRKPFKYASVVFILLFTTLLHSCSPRPKVTGEVCPSTHQPDLGTLQGDIMIMGKIAPPPYEESEKTDSSVVNKSAQDTTNIHVPGEGFEMGELMMEE